jgi:anti-sigma regulatory factor (Ser/Thr protein kinase)
VTVLCNLIELIRSRRGHEFFRPRDTDSATIRYLDDAGFFERYGRHRLRPGAALRETTFPVTPATHERSFALLEFEFLPWLAARAAVPPSAVAELKAHLGEIFNNIRDHSAQDIGCLFAQHFPRQRRVSIAVSDFGVGIPARVRAISPTLSDEQAILSACQEGFSTRTTPRNRGAGLAYLIRNLVVRLGGRVSIISGHGRVDFVYDMLMSDGRRQTPAALPIRYPRTLFDIDLPLDRLEADETAEEEFEW